MVKCIFCALLSLFFFTELDAQTALQVSVNNINSAKGKVLLALFKQEEGFPGNPKNAFLVRDCTAAKGSLKVVFENIPSGTYALAVFHDANNDGELNTNLVGIPKEDYGFSNNARPGFRAPTFQEAAFRIDNTRAISVTIK